MTKEYYMTEEAKIKKRAYDKLWREKHKAEIKAYREKNKEKIQEQIKNYKETHKEDVSEKNKGVFKELNTLQGHQNRINSVIEINYCNLISKLRLSYDFIRTLFIFWNNVIQYIQNNS